MPLQIMIATFLALVILGGLSRTGSAGRNEVTIVGGNQNARVIEHDPSNIIVITTVIRSNNRIMIVGQKHKENVQSIFTGNTTLPVQESNNHSKRKIIVRAA